MVEPMKAGAACERCGQPKWRHNEDTGVFYCPVVRFAYKAPAHPTAEVGDIVERLKAFADPDGRIPLPMLDEDGNRVGISRRTPEEMCRVEVHVDPASGTVWTPPTAWAYAAVCRARVSDENVERLREALKQTEDALQYEAERAGCFAAEAATADNNPWAGRWASALKEASRAMFKAMSTLSDARGASLGGSVDD